MASGCASCAALEPRKRRRAEADLIGGVAEVQPAAVALSFQALADQLIVGLEWRHAVTSRFVGNPDVSILTYGGDSLYPLYRRVDICCKIDMEA